MSTDNRPLISASRILLVIALLIFVLATFGVSLGGLQMIPLGFAFLAASMVV
jgi:hypothetical protein